MHQMRIIRILQLFQGKQEKIENEWINIYDLLSIDKLAVQYQERQAWWQHYDLNSYAENTLATRKEHLKMLIAKQR